MPHLKKMTNRQAAIKIIRKLKANGYQALLAGGCVRDMLLGKRAKDYDVATNARPKEVIRLFKRTIKVGAQFGVVMVMMGTEQVEVATFRSEAGYKDGRHPDKVKFTTAAEDAKRRDFTINGMFYDALRRKVIDYVDGQYDLKRKVICTIGKPEERFAEDYLRMLRAVRFSTQLNFKIEPGTFSAVCCYAKDILRISGERISMELEGILVSPNRSAGAAMLIETGLAGIIFPEFRGQYVQKAVKVLGQLRKRIDYPLALAGLFADCDTEFALEKCRLLKLSRNQTRHIKFLLSNRGVLLNDKMSLASLRKLAAQPYFSDLYELQKALQKVNKKSISPLIKIKKRIKALGEIELKPTPLLNGHDLIKLGAAPGPALGQLIEEIYIAQLEGQIKNKNQASHWASDWLEKHKISDTDLH